MSDYGIYEAMEIVYLSTGGKVVVNSAFKICSGEFLSISVQQGPEDAHALLVNRDATSARQLCEWGMRMIHGQFPCIKDPIRYKGKFERKIILCILVHLYNFQATQVDINQILNCFLEKGDTSFFGQDELTEKADISKLSKQLSLPESLLKYTFSFCSQHASIFVLALAIEENILISSVHLLSFHFGKYLYFAKNVALSFTTLLLQFFSISLTFSTVLYIQLLSSYKDLLTDTIIICRTEIVKCLGLYF